jgi:hypothetical protein
MGECRSGGGTAQGGGGRQNKAKHGSWGKAQGAAWARPCKRTRADGAQREKRMQSATRVVCHAPARQYIEKPVQGTGTRKHMLYRHKGRCARAQRATDTGAQGSTHGCQSAAHTGAQGKTSGCKGHCAPAKRNAHGCKHRAQHHQSVRGGGVPLCHRQLGGTGRGADGRRRGRQHLPHPPHAGTHGNARVTRFQARAQ